MNNKTEMINSLVKRNYVIDPRGVGGCYWNCKCSKCHNLFERDESQIDRIISPCCKVKFERIVPVWKTDGYMPKENKFIQELEEECEIINEIF